MINHDIVVVGASAGGIDALSELVKGLPSDLRAAIFVVIHIAPHSPGYLPDVLSMRGALPAKNARDGQRFTNSAIYVAPPDHHLLLRADRTMVVVRGPRENRARPAVDPLFRSAALAFGPRVIGLILSGGLDDGTAGLRGIKMCGGTTVVQDPGDALVHSMPSSALRNVSIDHCKPANELASLIVGLVESPAQEVPPPPEGRQMRKTLEIEAQLAKGTSEASVTELGDPSIFTCPECHGTLLKLRGEPMRYRCHTGHAFTADSLLAALSEVTEDAIWGSIRAMQENSMLMTHLAHHWRKVDPSVADEFLRKAKSAQARGPHSQGCGRARSAERRKGEVRDGVIGASARFLDRSPQGDNLWPSFFGGHAQPNCSRCAHLEPPLAAPLVVFSGLLRGSVACQLRICLSDTEEEPLTLWVAHLFCD